MLCVHCATGDAWGQETIMLYAMNYLLDAKSVVHDSTLCG